MLQARSMHGRLTIVLLIAALLASRAAAETQLVIEWRDQRLGVTAKSIPLVDILRAVARRTGLEVRGLERVQEVVSLQLSQVSLHTGIQHLLASTDHLMLVRTIPSGEVLPSLVLILGRKHHGVSDMTDGNVATMPPPEQDLNQRLIALQRLDTAPPAQRNALVSAALKDADPSVRQVAYRFLYEQREEDTLAEILKREAQSADIDRRRTAIETCGEFFTAETTGLLLQAATDEHPDIRHAAFAGLSQLDLPEAEQALRTQLTHPTPEVRLLAVEAMAARGRLAAREAALAALSDSDELVRSKGANLAQELKFSEGGLQ